MACKTVSNPGLFKMFCIAKGSMCDLKKSQLLEQVQSVASRVSSGTYKLKSVASERAANYLINSVFQVIKKVKRVVA